jgi:hypothetical protein
MTPRPGRDPSATAGGGVAFLPAPVFGLVSGLLLAGVLATAAPVRAASTSTSAASPSAAEPRVAPRTPAEQGVRWRDLKPAQQAALKPLEREWSGIAAPRKQKWLELSARYPTLSATEQARVQERMSEWARLTPLERGQARLNFQEAKQLPAQDRQERWTAYQALSPEQKLEFAARAARPAPVASEADRRNVTTKSAGTVREPAQVKSNIVPDPALATAPKAIAPTTVQAGPGATTTTITKRPMPPSHQQVGLPKIAASPGFVNKSTLLPQRGPQGAATRSAAAAASEPPSRQ